MDNSNLRDEQKEALRRAIEIIEGVRRALSKDPDAVRHLVEAENQVNAVLSGDRSKELGPAI